MEGEAERRKVKRTNIQGKPAQRGETKRNAMRCIGGKLTQSNTMESGISFETGRLA